MTARDSRRAAFSREQRTAVDGRDDGTDKHSRPYSEARYTEYVEDFCISLSKKVHHLLAKQQVSVQIEESLVKIAQTGNCNVRTRHHRRGKTRDKEVIYGVTAVTRPVLRAILSVLEPHCVWSGQDTVLLSIA